jgi:hypothetical protein
VQRRTFIKFASAVLAAPWDSLIAKSADYPTEVAGITLPRTPLCCNAYVLCQSSAPAFLLNHSMRTYVFGALHAAHRQQHFDAEPAFVAATLHDLGLLRKFASETGSFEIDGADGAEQFARDHGASAKESSTVWNAVVMHDMRFSIASHQSPEATLVAAGAGADVIGPDEEVISAAAVRDVVAAFPRLQFKQKFIALLANHCERKPGAQTGTWLEGFCRQHSRSADSRTEEAIRQAPFPE